MVSLTDAAVRVRLSRLALCLLACDVGLDAVPTGKAIAVLNAEGEDNASTNSAACGRESHTQRIARRAGRVKSYFGIKRLQSSNQ